MLAHRKQIVAFLKMLLPRNVANICVHKRVCRIRVMCLKVCQVTIHLSMGDLYACIGVTFSISRTKMFFFSSCYIQSQFCSMYYNFCAEKFFIFFSVRVFVIIWSATNMFFFLKLIFQTWTVFSIGQTSWKWVWEMIISNYDIRHFYVCTDQK